MKAAQPDNEYTREFLFPGRLACFQHRHGYRYSVDAVLLAHFISPAQDARLLDLGAGCGVISLILAHRRPRLLLTALEVQPRLAALIRRNVEVNQLQERITVIEGDCRKIGELVEPGGFDWLVCNPPYGKAGAGRRSLENESAIARHEIMTTVDEVVQAAACALKDNGKAAFVFPFLRSDELLAALNDKNLAPSRLQVVHDHPGGQAKLILVEAVKDGAPKLVRLPPFYVKMKPGGAYSPAMAACYQP